MAKKVCLYGVLTALCMVFGYIESLVSLSFIAPGIKLGLANGVALLLLARGDIKGAFAVNLTRIVLSALLFGSPFSLIFSLSGGIASLAVMALLTHVRSMSVIGFSITGGAIHNLFQLLAALAVVGRGAVYYLPILLLCGGLSGFAVGIISSLILKKIKTNPFF